MSGNRFPLAPNAAALPSSMRPTKLGDGSPIDHAPEDILDDGTVLLGFQVTPGEILAPS
jgi:hypothetical protein